MAINVNRVTLCGRLGADPERSGGANSPVICRVATSESWKDKNTGEKREKTEWHNVKVWAEPSQNFLLNYAHKGDLVYIEGQLETSSYEKDGVTHYSTAVVIKPFVGVVQLQSKEGSSEGSSRSSSERGGGSRDSSRNHGSDEDNGFGRSSRPGSSRSGQNRPAFEPGGMDDDIPF